MFACSLGLALACLGPPWLALACCGLTLPRPTPKPPQINVRQLSYIGSGLRGNLKIDPTSYGVGDIVPQMPPDCVAVSRESRALSQLSVFVVD
jgi:hypothetical protein